MRGARIYGTDKRGIETLKRDVDLIKKQYTEAPE
jgi:hypothetical protein